MHGRGRVLVVQTHPVIIGLRVASLEGQKGKGKKSELKDEKAMRREQKRDLG